MTPCAMCGRTDAYQRIETETYHALAVAHTPHGDANDRWDTVQALAAGDGWRLLGWRNYATDDGYHVTADLYRTVDDVRAGALQLTMDGAPSVAPVCPLDAIDADECAMFRERSVAGVSNDVPACPVHGAYPEARCGRTDPHGGHADPATAWRFCVGNVNIVTAQDAAR